MPNTSSTSPVKAETDYKIGDHVIYPAQGVCTITKTESTSYAGQDFTVFVLKRFDDEEDTTRLIRIPQAKIGREVKPLPPVEDLLKAERMLATHVAKGPGSQAGATKVYALINSWDFLKMAEGVARLRPCIKIYPASTPNALPAMTTAIDRIALVTSLVTGEDRAACIGRLTLLADAVPAPAPVKPVKAVAKAGENAVAEPPATPV